MINVKNKSYKIGAREISIEVFPLHAKKVAMKGEEHTMPVKSVHLHVSYVHRTQRNLTFAGIHEYRYKIELHYLIIKKQTLNILYTFPLVPFQCYFFNIAT